MNLGVSPIKHLWHLLEMLKIDFVKKLLRLGIYIGKYIYEIFSKFYGNVGVILHTFPFHLTNFQCMK